MSGLSKIHENPWYKILKMDTTEHLVKSSGRLPVQPRLGRLALHSVLKQMADAFQKSNAGISSETLRTFKYVLIKLDMVLMSLDKFYSVPNIDDEGSIKIKEFFQIICNVDRIFKKKYPSANKKEEFQLDLTDTRAQIKNLSLDKLVAKEEPDKDEKDLSLHEAFVEAQSQYIQKRWELLFLQQQLDGFSFEVHKGEDELGSCYEVLLQLWQNSDNPQEIERIFKVNTGRIDKKTKESKVIKYNKELLEIIEIEKNRKILLSNVNKLDESTNEWIEGKLKDKSTQIKESKLKINMIKAKINIIKEIASYRTKKSLRSQAQISKLPIPPPINQNSHSAAIAGGVRSGEVLSQKTSGVENMSMDIDGVGG